MTMAIDNYLTSSDRTVHTAGRHPAITVMMFPATTGPPGLQSAPRPLPAAGPDKDSGRQPSPPPAGETAGP